jgi:hypothetical protein
VVGISVLPTASTTAVEFTPTELRVFVMRNWEGRRRERDTVARLGYVMMTRARENLVICEPAGSNYMPVARMAAKVRL